MILYALPKICQEMATSLVANVHMAFTRRSHWEFLSLPRPDTELIPHVLCCIASMWPGELRPDLNPVAILGCVNSA